MNTDTTSAGPTRQQWMALAVLALATFLSAFDLFVMLLAIPRINVELGASSTQALWTLDIYGFMVAGFLITMGGIGDRFGHRRLLLIGAAVFGMASIICAFAPSAEWLIAGRALLGIAGATLGPATLSLIMAIFTDPKHIGIGIAVWAGSFQGGAIIGPIAGGFLLNHFWWGSVFLLGVPAMALLLLLGPKLLPEARNDSATRIDLASVALSLGAILALVYGLKEVPSPEGRTIALAALAAGLVMGTLFVQRQRTLEAPLVDLALFRSAKFSSMLISLAGFSMMSGVTMVFYTQYLQDVRSLSPLAAGAALSPGLLLGILSVTTAPILARKIRPAVLIAMGTTTTAGGLLVISLADGSSSIPVVIGHAISCLGGGPILALGMQVIMMSAPQERSGMVSSLGQIANEMGYSLGIAVVGTIGATVYSSTLASRVPADTPPNILEVAKEGVSRAIAIAAEEDVSGLAVAAQSSFVTTLSVVATIAAIVVALIGVTLLRTLRDLPTVQGGDDDTDPSSGTDASESANQEPAGDHAPRTAGVPPS